MAAPIVLIEGFEHQSHLMLSEVTGIGSTTFPAGRLGGNCLRVDSNYASVAIPGTHEEVCVGFAMKGDSYTSNSSKVFSIVDTQGSILLNIDIANVGANIDHYTGGSGSVVKMFSSFPGPGLWTYLEVKFKYASSGYVHVRLNGQLVVTYTGNTLRSNAATGVIGSMQFSGVSSGANYFSFDDVWVERGSGADFRGSRKVIRLLPNGDNSIGWGFATGGGAHFSQVNDSSNTATYISELQGSGQADMFDVENPGTSITAVERVQVDALAARSSVTPGNVAVRSGATTGASKPVLTEGNTYSLVRETFSVPGDLASATVGVVAST